MKQVTLFFLIVVLSILFCLPSGVCGESSKALFDRGDGDWRLRYESYRLLGENGTSDARAISTLIEGLEDEDSLVRRAAAEALGKMGNASTPAVPALVQVLDQDYAGVAASQALQQIGPESVSALMLVVSNPRERRSLRIAAIRTLAEFGPQPKSVVGDLVKLLKVYSFSRAEFVNAICYALGEIGPKAGLASDTLLSLCNHQESLIRLEAARTLGKIDPLPSNKVQALILALGKEQERLERVSQGVMDARGMGVRRDRPEWETRADEERCVRVQMEMVFSIDKLQRKMSWEEASSIALPALIEVLRYTHTDNLKNIWHPMHHGCYCPQCHLYIAAAKALRYYGPKAGSALSELERLFEYESPRNELQRTIEAIKLDCYLDPPLLPSSQTQAKAKFIVRDEKFLSDDGRHVIVVLRVRNNALTKEQLEHIFPNAVEGWVEMDDKLAPAQPGEKPVADRVAKIPVEKTGDVWVAHLTIPKIDNCTLDVWDTTGHDYSGYRHQIPFAWSPPEF